MTDKIRIENSDSVSSASENSLATDAPPIGTASIVYFIIMWVVFGAIGFWIGNQSGWLFILSILFGMIAGFIMSCVTTVLAALGLDL